MSRRVVAAALALVLASGSPAALAENAMGYKLLSAPDAAALPRGGGTLGLNVGRAQQITDDGLTFDIMRVRQVRGGSPGAKAGFKPGDDIIAVDGRVFPSIAVFARYVGSIQPGGTISVDYIPSGGGPGQAQRVSVTIAASNGASAAQAGSASSSAGSSAGMSTGEKVAIGVGAVALLGCYEMGCFSRKAAAPAPTQPAPSR